MRNAVAVLLLVVGVSLAGCTGISGSGTPGVDETRTTPTPTPQQPSSDESYSTLTGGVGGEGYVPGGNGHPALVAGENLEAELYISNHEGQTQEYTIVVQLQGYTYDGDLESGNATLRVRNRTTLARWSVTAPDGERTRTTANFTVPNETGTSYRLAILRYTGDPPATPTEENAEYEPWYLPVNVTTTERTATAHG